MILDVADSAQMEHRFPDIISSVLRSLGLGWRFCLSASLYNKYKMSVTLPSTGGC